MGWAWRSSESYGDKDAPKDTPDTDSPGAKEPEAAGRESTGSWWDQFHSDSKSTTYSYDSSYGTDDWRGYQGPVYEEYSYDKSIDDSDTRWYRKSSFRYGSYKDYSPSSLFRSAFYSSKSSFYGFASEENEAKNKAIRALRTLSRNANTICDKDAKISYAVQYSSGSDTNTFEETLIDGKSVKTIYVSPDSVVDAKTTEDEDEAVDALTGFVLLRVQIAQEFTANTITEINGTTLRSLPMSLMKMLKQTEKPSAATMAVNHVDNCLAGMLSKGILTRLARRKVVKDWGGFAPYFVRHAKRFAGVREKLETTELSVESIVGKLTYNTIDDEKAFEIAPEIDAIVAKYLGEEVPAEQLLAACQQMIAELRAYLVKNNDGETVAGPLENGLSELVEEFMRKHAKSAEQQQKEMAAAEDILTKFAEALNSSFMQHKKETYAQKELTAEKDEEFAHEIEQLYAIEQMLTSLKGSNDSLRAHRDALERAEKESPTEIPLHTSRGQFEQAQLAARMAHFAPLRKDMEKRGATEKFDPANYTPKAGEKLADLLNKEIDDLSKLVDDYQNVLKNETQKLRDKIIELVKQTQKEKNSAKENAKASIKELDERFKRVNEKFEAAGEPRALTEALAAMRNMQKAAQTWYESVEEQTQDNLKAIEGCRGIKTLRREYDKFKMQYGNSFTFDPRSDWQYTVSGYPTAEFVQSAIRAQHRIEAATPGNIEHIQKNLDKSEWQVSAIAKFIQQTQSQDSGFESLAMAQIHSEVLEQIKELFKDAEMSMPNSFDDIGNEDLRSKLEKLADSLGLNCGDELLQMAKAADGDMPMSTLNAAGEEFGKKIRGLLPLFDEINSTDNQLFGEMIMVKTNVLGDATKQVNDEARNDPEEEYVAYLSHSEAKPVVYVQKPRITAYAKLEAQESRTRQRNIISRIREALQFHNSKRTGEVYGVRSGDLDEGGLHKLGYDCEHIWAQKTVAQIPDVAVGILVDQSGSMCGGRKIYEAREMCIALAEAVKKIPGIHLHIYGHTANTRSSSDLTLFEHYSSVSDTATATADLSSLGTIDAISNNYDGYAIKETAKLLAKDPAKRKYLFVIADGLPHGDGYCGKEAEKHVTSVCQFVRERLKIATYAFAVGVPNSHRAKFISQYGKDNVMFLTTVGACLPQVTRFLRNTIQKEKTLVEIGS